MFDMRLRTVILTALLALWLFLPLPAYGASSAATRAIDDAEATSQDFAGQNLQEAEFSNNKLVGANFSGANLRGIVFNGVDLAGANFQNVDMTDGLAYLSNFSQVDLTGAILTEAILLQSNFKGATVTNADFSFAILDKDQVAYLCAQASGSNPVTGVDTRESLGCA
ncbi:MAG: pentapeptide repeat-containing protein [Acaryochloridaceae cyanobacterium SU_2_1]|nr:pentapeptide repeat-containing protein [Acaryochloridaceae cyanobacterium SU_2_1]